MIKITTTNLLYENNECVNGYNTIYKIDLISADESITHARHTMLVISIPIKDYIKLKSEDKIHIL